MRSGRLLTLALAAVFIVLLAGIALGQADDATGKSDQPKAPAEKLTREQRKQMDILMSRLKKSGAKTADRIKFVQQAESIGPSAVAAVDAAFRRDLTAGVIKYQEAYAEAAKKVVANLDRNAKLEVDMNQQQVNALRGREDLTKEEIKSEGVPAMKRLVGLLLVDQKQLLEANTTLAAQRGELLDLARLVEKSSAYLARQAGKERRSDATPEKYLADKEELAALLALPLAEDVQATLVKNGQLEDQLDREEARTIRWCNTYRVLLGLKPLEIELKLCAAARDHSQDMKALKFFDHESPVEGKRTFSDRARRFGVSAYGENIHHGVADGRKANDGWFRSPGHHKNMLGKHGSIGVGRSGDFYTEMFGE